jgi:hypothetical protein
VREALVALFAALPAVELVFASADWDGALNRLAASPTHLIILEAALVSFALDGALGQLRAAAPGSARLVIVDEVHQLVPAAGAEVHLLKGAPAAELVAALRGLLGQPQG